MSTPIWRTVSQALAPVRIQPYGRVMHLQRQVRAVMRARWHFRNATDLGTKVRVWGRPAVRNDGTMIVHPRVRLVSTLAKTELVSSPNGTLEIGESAFINYGCSIAASELVKIGPGCNIGTHAILMDNDFHELDPERRNETPESKPIILEENVWLGGRVIVLAGVTIGANSVVGAGSVVTKDVPANHVVAGIPAKIVRQL